MTPEQICADLNAAKELAARRVQELLPEGTIVMVKLSRALVRFQVTGYCWGDPLRVRGVNTDTEKAREMVIGYDDFDIVRRAAAKKGGRK